MKRKPKVFSEEGYKNYPHHLEAQRKEFKKIALYFLITIIILGLALIWQTIMVLKYQTLYHEAIKQGAESVVGCIELTSACVSLGNFSQEEVFNKWVDMFLKKGEEDLK